MQFNDVIGQRQTKELFIQLAKEQRVPHAMLLVGPPGNGKLGMALAFAQYLNCRDKTEGDSCGVCSSCLKFKKLIHPDLHFTIPVVKTSAISKPTSTDYLAKWRSYFLANPYPIYERWNQLIAEENKQGMIYVDEAAEIIQKLNRKSYEADYKVSLIWLPETMHLTCANKILKVLEEPPANTLFILVTEEEQRLISTIRSRCQTIRIPRIDEQDLAQALTHHPELRENNPAVVARMANGNYILAEEMLLEDEVRRYNYRLYTSLMRSGYGRNLQELLAWSDEISSIGRVRQLSFLRYCCDFTRENFVSNFRQPDLVTMSEEEEKFANKFAPFIHDRNVLHLFTEFEKSLKDIASNGNAKAVFTDMALKISKLIRL
ncbi:MAG: DNA polymerase III subunit [Prolixibacteraceae bacterium]|jgi:DNA polymerase-3 subunit delta'|nr:DNA polymerase III subunit [Prolixibacteraceae bacterium]